MNRRRLLLLSPLWLAGCGNSETVFHNSVIDATRFGGAWDIHDVHGRPQQIGDFQGQVVILFFGYTHCPDVCPTALAKYAALLNGGAIPGGKLKILFCTLDPERDTPENLRDYLHWFDPDILGLTGSSQQVADFSRQFRVVAVKKESPGGMGYVIDHTAGAYVFDPAGKLRLYLAENAKPEDILSDLLHLLAGR